MKRSIIKLYCYQKIFHNISYFIYRAVNTTLYDVNLKK